MQSIITILGATATGKSSLAIELAKQFKGEIISADSRQIYKDFDIGSGKVTLEEIKDVPHYMLNICELWENYSMAEFQKEVRSILKELNKKQVLPFLVGGTGLYIESIIYDYQLNNIPVQNELREELSKLDKFELQNKLLLLNPKINLNQSDWNNPVRLIRSIELAKFGVLKENKINNNSYMPLLIGLSSSLEDIKYRITQRVDVRLKTGAIEEVKNIQSILSHKLSPNLAKKKIAQFGLGTIAISQYLDNKISYDLMRQKYIQSEYQYARRQLTWFRRMPQINWFEANDKDLLNKTNQLISEFLK